MRARSAPAALVVTACLFLTGACGDDDSDGPRSPRGAEDPTIDDGDEGGTPTTDY